MEFVTKACFLNEFISLTAEYFFFDGIILVFVFAPRIRFQVAY